MDRVIYRDFILNWCFFIYCSLATVHLMLQTEAEIRLKNPSVTSTSMVH